MCCQSGLFVLCQLCFYCPWKAAASAAQSRSPCSGRNNGTSVFLEKERRGVARRSEVGTGWGDAGFMLGRNGGSFPCCEAPLCLLSGRHALLSHQGSGEEVGAWEGRGGGRGPCSRCSHTVTLRWVCPSRLVKQKTVFLSPAPHTQSPTGSSCIIIIHHVSCQLRYEH